MGQATVDVSSRFLAMPAHSSPAPPMRNPTPRESRDERHAERELQAGVRGGAHAELCEEAMDGAVPGLLASRTVERVHPVEAGPVAIGDGDLVDPSREDGVLACGRGIPLTGRHGRRVGGHGAITIAVPLDRLGQHDGLRPGQRMVGDGGHLVHVLGGRVGDRVVGVQVTLVDRPLPRVLEEGQDGHGLFGGAAVDEIAVLVVRERDVLRGAEPVQRVLPALHLHVGVAGGEQCHDADDDERDSGDP